MKTLLVPLALATAVALPALSAERAVEKVAIIPASNAEVWRAWTTSEGIVSFFAPEAIVEPKPFGRFSIHMNPFAAPGMKGADDMLVLAVQEPKMISFTWNAPPHLPEARAQRTVVIVRMKPVSEKETEVTIHQTGWGDGGQWDETFKYFDAAWGRVLANMQKRFVERKPIDWTPFLDRLRTTKQ